MSVASSGAVRSGGAFVELFCKDGALHGALNRAKRAIQSFGAFVGKAGSMAAMAGGALLAPLTMLLKGGVNYAAELDDLADAFSTTTEKLSPMAFAFKKAGLTLEDFGKALSFASEAAQNGESVEAALLRIIHTLNEIPDAAKRANAFKDVFGKGGRNIAAVAGDIDKHMKDAPIISTAEAKAAEKATQDFAAALLKLQVALLPIVVMLVPFITQISEWSQRNAAVLPDLARLVVLVIGAGFALKVMAAGCTVAAFGIAGVSAALLATKAVLLALLTPLGLLIGGLGALAVWGARETGQFDGSMKQMGDGFRGMAETGKEALSGIVAAWQAGDLELAAEIALKGIETAFAQFILTLTEQWNRFKSVFVDGWEEAKTETAKKLLDFSDSWWTVGGLTKKIFGGGRDNDKIKNELDKMRDEDRAARQRFREEEERDQKAAIERRKAELKKLKDLAITKRDLPKVAKFAIAMAGGMGGMSEAEIERRAHEEEEIRKARARLVEAKPTIMAALADASAGMFTSPNFAQSLGLAGSIDKQQLEVQKQILDAIHDVADKVSGIGPALFQ